MSLNKFVFIIPGRLSKSFSFYFSRHFSRTSKLYSFYERDTRGAEYPLVIDKPLTQILKESNKAFVEECKKFWEETKEDFRQDRKIYKHGDTDVFFRFDSEVKYYLHPPIFQKKQLYFDTISRSYLYSNIFSSSR